MSEVAPDSSALARVVATDDRPPLEYLWRFDVAVTPAVLWAYIRDTSALNRALGLAPMQFEERDGVIFGRNTLNGIEQRWVEHVWSWVVGRVMVAERSYSRGWARRIRVVYELERNEAGTQLSAYYGWWPRGWLARVLLQLVMPLLRKRWQELLSNVTEDGRVSALPPSSVAPLPTAAVARLGQVADKLIEHGCERALVERLVKLIRYGHDDELYRLRVRKLARQWQVDERRLLEVFLYATRAGLLALSWDVICPHCRGPRMEADALEEVPSMSACEVCQVEFGTDLKNAIEITFHLHPSVRQVEKQIFCSAQAATQRHVLVQQHLAAGEDKRQSVALPVGRYRMRLLGAAEATLLDVKDDGQAELQWEAQSLPEPCALKPQASVHFVNDALRPSTFVIEELSWADDALAPSQLFSCASFRDLFSEQLIAPDVRLFVGEQVLLFTDLVGSTRMYLERGDADAFAAVRAHFRAIGKLIAEHHGALVKTIGDAAMAVFDEPTAAVAAAFALRSHFEQDVAGLGMQVRVTLNTGVCLAVNLNSRIDYFGHAVNVAAKLQELAGPGEVVLSKALSEAPGVAEQLASEPWRGEPVALQLKGVAEPIVARRYPPRATPAVAASH